MITVLHTNDFHGRLTEEMAGRIAAWKAEAGEGAFYFDSGDCIKAGNLAIPLRQEEAWERLYLAGCDAGTMGNRESHVLEAGMNAKLKGRRHPLLVANLRGKSGDKPLPGSLVIERAGVKVGLVGVMVPIVTERMLSRKASQYVWDSPIPAAKRLADVLRPEVDCLIALTHIGHTKDLELAKVCPEFDLVLGGHSHTFVGEPIRVGDTFVCQEGAMGKFLGIFQWEARGKLASSELRLLSSGG